MRWFLLCGLAACGSRTAAPTGAGPTASLSANAPDWARAGDQKTSGGKLFVCEGGGATEELAQRAAHGTCSAKICELCGVEVKSTVETRENLQKVSIERKVVETCRRVRKAEEEVRYKQSACGPGGCTSWLQVFFSAEAEARECKAYADGNYADPAECERLIDQFRNTPGLESAAFRARVALLDQAIIACAEIDVRPTPKLTAMDEIVWQGVVSPSHTPWQPTADDQAKPIAERVRTRQHNRAIETAREHASFIYKGIARQGLLECKIFVDKLAKVRDAMRAYASIVAVTEALAAVHYTVEPKPDTTGLVAAMRDVIPLGELDRERMHTWVRNDLIDTKRDYPAVRDFLLATYPPPWTQWQKANRFADFFAADDTITDQEWAAIMQGPPCLHCLRPMVNARNHGSDAKRVARIVEAVNKIAADPVQGRNVANLVSDLDADWLMRVESKLSAAAGPTIYTWERWKRAYDKLPPKGVEPAGDQMRKQLVARLGKQLDQSVASESCEKLDGKLELLEREGQDTRRFEAALCRCLADAKDKRRVGHLDELYLRLVDWNAACVRKGGPS